MPPPEPPSHRKRTLLQERWAKYVAFGVPGLTIVLVIGYAILTRDDDVDIHPPPAYSAAPQEPAWFEQASNLRALAIQACGATRWKECLNDLDRAKDLDPGGDETGDVKQLRQQAEQALRPIPSGPARERP